MIPSDKAANSFDKSSSLDTVSKKEISHPLDKVDVNILLEQNYKYYLDYLKIEETNRLLKNELSSLLKEKNDLKQCIARLDRRNRKLYPDESKKEINDLYTNRKRHRRGKNEIKRMFKCGYPNCGKTYGSEGSLNQHIKIKHNGKEYNSSVNDNNNNNDESSKDSEKNDSLESGNEL